MEIFNDLESLSTDTKNRVSLASCLEPEDIDFLGLFKFNSADCCSITKKITKKFKNQSFLYQIQNWMHLTIREVAGKINMPLTTFKKNLKAYKIRVWPRRQILLLYELYKFREIFNEDEIRFFKSITKHEYIFSKIKFPDSVIKKYRNAKKRTKII
tara:strand:- start:82 stop:549 length:468 start_codon:yes stop_codon:yes gene_type:complete